MSIFVPPVAVESVSDCKAALIRVCRSSPDMTVEPFSAVLREACLSAAL